MKLSAETKAAIDRKSYEGLLYDWRFAPAGSPWFLGEVGEYFKKRMDELRDGGADHVGASKSIGWDKP